MRRMQPNGFFMGTPSGLLIAKRYPLLPAIGWTASRDSALLVTCAADSRVAVFERGYHAMAAAVAHAGDGLEQEVYIDDSLRWESTDGLRAW
jgi:hypothetical protein